MKIFHRIDDVQKYSKEMKEILDFFEYNTEEFIVAVIPKDFDERYKKIIESYKHCTVYQHGYGHVNYVENGWNDEFPDFRDYSQCFSQISEGKKSLEKTLGIPINGYVPPWNNTGSETIKIIKELGFSVYSAQENNTISYEKNKDISIDVVDKYIPRIVYKELNSVYQQICELIHKKGQIGIMYHFRNISLKDWEEIKKFVRKVEELKKHEKR